MVVPDSSHRRVVTPAAQVTFFTNSLTVLGMIISTAANGNLSEFLSYAITSRTAATHMVR